MSSTHTRVAGAELTGDGRTLEGLAFRWDTPAMVRDGNGPAYLEEFHRSSVRKTLTERARRPLGLMHPWAPGATGRPSPIGAVEFKPSAEGLAFKARMSNTAAGNEALELVNDGALSDVSVGFNSFANRYRMLPAGRVTTRMEIGLMELSLVPTGMGAHPGAEVHAVRATVPGTTRRTMTPEQVRRRLLLLSQP